MNVFETNELEFTADELETMKGKKRAELILFLSAFFNSLVFFAPVAILVRTRCGITISQFFMLQAVLSFGIFIFEVPCGFVTDKIGYRTSIIISQILLCITRVIFLIGGTFFLFIVEAVMEAISISFISGTTDAYMYDMYEEDEYMPKMAVMDNYGTVGFILSTLAFIPLNKLFGINGLIAATLLSLLISLAIIFFLPTAVYKIKEKEFDDNDTESEKENKPYMKTLIKSLCTKEVIFFFIISSLLSIASLIISFFYILKLIDNNISEDWMSFIILGYSGLQMLNPIIIKKLQKFNPGIISCFAYFCIAVMFILLNIFSGFLVFIPMLLLPIFISVPGFFISNITNHLIDKLGQQKNRAAFLSVLNQGANLCEIFFLFFASAAGSKTVSFIFLIIACSFFLLSFITFLFRNTDYFKIKYIEK